MTNPFQTTDPQVFVGGDAVLSGSTLNLAGSVDGPHVLAVNGSASVTLSGPNFQCLS